MKRGRDKFNQIKSIINLLVWIVKKLPYSFRLKMFECTRTTKGKIGLVVRYILLKSLAKSLGDNVFIAPGCYIFNVDKISIGNNVSIHPMCYIEGKGEIVIGDDVSIAHGVTIMSEAHIFDNISIPIKDQGMLYKKTIIESDVWIGAKATILAGNKIGTGAIVGASAVVTKNVDNYCVVGGVPAVIIKNRK